MRVKTLLGAYVLGSLLSGCFLSTVMPPKEIKSPEGTTELKTRQDSYDCAKVRDHRGKSEESFLVEPGEIGLAPLEEAANGINQDAKGRLAQLAAGLAE